MMTAATSSDDDDMFFMYFDHYEFLGTCTLFFLFSSKATTFPLSCQFNAHHRPPNPPLCTTMTFALTTSRVAVRLPVSLARRVARRGTRAVTTASSAEVRPLKPRVSNPSSRVFRSSRDAQNEERLPSTLQSRVERNIASMYVVRDIARRTRSTCFQPRPRNVSWLWFSRNQLSLGNDFFSFFSCRAHLHLSRPCNPNP